MRYGVLKKHLGEIGADDKCLLVTCGDNNGAMNYNLRELSGQWSFADLEDTCVAEMSELLGEEVKFLPDDDLGYPDSSFDRIVTIDVHEHLDDCTAFSREIGRIAAALDWDIPGSEVKIDVATGIGGVHVHRWDRPIELIYVVHSDVRPICGPCRKCPRNE